MKSYFFITKDQRILDNTSDTYKRHKLYFVKNKNIKNYLVLLKHDKIKNLSSIKVKNDLNICEIVYGYFNFFKKILTNKKLYKIILQDFSFVILPILMIKIFKKFKILSQIHGELYSFRWFFLNFKNPLMFIYTHLLVFFIDEIRVVNNKTKKNLEKIFKEKKIYNIPVPIIYKFSKKNNKVNYNNIIFITEFVKIKNYQGIKILLDKINQSDLNVNNVNIFGDGKFYLKFKNSIINNKYNFNVIFHGYKKLDIMEKYLQNSFFLINISKSESYSRSIVESFKCNLPVLSFKSTGPNELIQNECLVNYKDYNSIINKLLFFYNNKDQYLLLKKNINNFDKNYIPFKIVKKWSNLIYQ